MELIEFEKYLYSSGKSVNTVKSYILCVNKYVTWFKDSYDIHMSCLYRENILEYKNYLLNVKRVKGCNLKASSINVKLSAIIELNKFLTLENAQTDIVLSKRDFVKVQRKIANPCKVNKRDIENFRQNILENKNSRLYAIVTILSYGG